MWGKKAINPNAPDLALILQYMLWLAVFVVFAYLVKHVSSFLKKYFFVNMSEGGKVAIVFIAACLVAYKSSELLHAYRESGEAPKFISFIWPAGVIVGVFIIVDAWSRRDKKKGGDEP